jgi:hypothetical protein
MRRSLRNLFQAFAGRPIAPRAAPPRRTPRLHVEALEERAVPAALLVDQYYDFGAPGTLHITSIAAHGKFSGTFTENAGPNTPAGTAGAVFGLISIPVTGQLGLPRGSHTPIFQGSTTTSHVTHSVSLWGSVTDDGSTILGVLTESVRVAGKTTSHAYRASAQSFSPHG